MNNPDNDTRTQITEVAKATNEDPRSVVFRKDGKTCVYVDAKRYRKGMIINIDGASFKITRVRKNGKLTLQSLVTKRKITIHCLGERKNGEEAPS